MAEYKDTSIALFEYYYQVRVIPLDSMTPDMLNRYGVRDTGNKELNRAQLTNHCIANLNIAQMAARYAEGHHIGIVKEADLCPIYEAIFKHVSMWRGILRETVNTSNAPIQDLQKLDAFGQAVHRYAVDLYGEDSLERIFGRELAGFMTKNMHSIFRRTMAIPHIATPIPEEPAKPSSQEPSFGDFMKARLPGAMKKG